MLHAILVVGVLSVSSLKAEEVPTVGYVQHTTEMGSLRYECLPKGSQVVVCDFTQVSISTKRKPDDLTEIVSAAQTEFKAGNSNIKPPDCAQYEKLAAALRASGGEGAARFSDPRARQDAIKSVDSLVTFCKTPSEANFINIAKISHAKDMRTCRVYTHTFSQTFKKVQNANTWTSNDGPTGPCGTIVVAMFERDPTSTMFWKARVTTLAQYSNALKGRQLGAAILPV